MTTLPSLPEELKFINPYLIKARETRKREPVISYYCSYYAAKLALDKGTKSKESKAFIAKLLDTLEQEKKEFADNDAITNDVAGEAYLDNFSLKVFTIADNEDRNGKATKNTAKTFISASIYMELLKVFGNLSPEVEDKIRYAKWKAIDITKALNEGRTPTPGPPGGELEENKKDSSVDDQLPSDQTTTTTTTAAIVTGPSPLPDNDTFPSFPSAPTNNYNSNSVPNVQDLVSSFDRIDVGKQIAPTNNYNNNSVPNVQDLVSSFDQIDVGQPIAPPLPPKISNDYTGNNNNIFDNNQFNQNPPTSSTTSTFSPPPNNNNTNFYDIHQNYQQPLPPTSQPPQLSQSTQPIQPHTNFTNDYSQSHHYQPSQPPQPQQPQQPPQSHNSFLPPTPQPPPQSYIQKVNPSSRQFSTPLSNQLNQPQSQLQNYTSPPQPQAELDPSTADTVKKYCRFASSALDYSDVETAVDYMNRALDMLKPHRNV